MSDDFVTGMFFGILFLLLMFLCSYFAERASISDWRSTCRENARLRKENRYLKSKGEK